MIDSSVRTPERCGYIVEFDNQSFLWGNKDTLRVGGFDNRQDAVRFQRTKMKLFSHFPEQANQKEVYRDEIFIETWDKQGLKPSGMQ